LKEKGNSFPFQTKKKILFLSLKEEESLPLLGEGRRLLLYSKGKEDALPPSKKEEGSLPLSKDHYASKIRQQAVRGHATSLALKHPLKTPLESAALLPLLLEDPSRIRDLRIASYTLERARSGPQSGRGCSVHPGEMAMPGQTRLFKAR